MNYASIVPLIGGETIAMENVFGKRPDYMLTFDGFQANETHLINYYNNEVPYLNLSEGAKPPHQVDVVNTVCPCAGLSSLSPSASSNNEANDWMYKSAEYVLEQIQPKVFWGENAPRLASKMGEPVVKKLRKIGEKNGYTFSIIKTKSILHGLSQVRDRTFYFFWDSEYAPIMNWYDRPMPELEEFLGQIPSHASGQKEFVSNKDPDDSLVRRFVHTKTGLSHEGFIRWEGDSDKPKHSYWRWLEKHDVMNECLNWIEKNYSKDEKDYKRLYNAKAKLDAGKNYMVPGPFFFDKKVNAMVGRTITSTLHPYHERYLTVREVMHLMGMPHDFEFSPSEQGATINMLAQNVPSFTAADMTTEVLKYLRGDLELSEQSFLMQNNFKQKTI